MMPRQLVGTIKTIVFTLATAAALSAMADDYYWDGTASGNWSDAHWKLDNSGDATTYSFTTSDKAVFTSDAEVTLTANVNIKDVVVNANLTLLGNGCYLIPQQNGNITGSGTITLGDNVGIRSAKDSKTTISVPLEIDSTGGKLTATHGNYSGEITTTGEITGSGALTLESAKSGNSSKYGNVTINSDMSGFTGTIADGMGYGRIMTADCSGASLRYSATTAYNYPFYPDTAYKFAAVTATIPAATESGTYSLTIGEDKTLDSSLTGDWGTLATANITFASSGTLTNACANIASLTVSNGGTVYFPSATGIPTTLTFSNGGTVLVDNEEVAAAVAEKITGQQNVTIKFPSLKVTAGATVAYSLTDNATVAITLANDTKTGDTLLTSTAGNLPTGATYTLLSPNTGSASLFFDDVVSGSTVTAKYKQDVYVWAGADNGTLATASNWKVADAEGSIETVAGTAPSATINCVFPADATVSVGKCNSGSILLLGDVTLDSTTQSWGDSYINFGNGSVVEGSGKFITIDNGMPAFRNTGVTATFYSDIEFQSSSFAFWSSSGNSDGTYTFYGRMITASSKTVTLADAGAGKTGKMKIVVAGDMSEFEGTLETAYSNSSSSYLPFTGDATNLVNATVVLGDKGNGTALCGSAGTYTFGSLSGKVTGGSEAVTIVTGSGDAEAKSIAYTPGSADWTLKKEGSKLLTITGEDFASYVINGGKLATVLAQTIDGDTPTIATEVDGKIVKGEGDNVYSLKNRNPFMVIIR